MKDFLKQNKIQLAVGIYLILAAAFFYFLILGFAGKIADKADGIERNKVDAELNDKRLGDVSAMEADDKLINGSASDLDVLITSDREVDAIKDLEALAGQTGNQIEFQVKDPSADSKPGHKVDPKSIEGKLSDKSYLSMQIALEGKYPNLLDFMRKLENYGDYINVISFSSEKQAAAPSSGGNTAGGTANPFIGKPNSITASSGETLNTILDVDVYLKK